MDFIYWLIIITLVIYLRDISHRISKLEKFIKGGQVSAADQVAEQHLPSEPMPGAAHMVDASVHMEQKPRMDADAIHTDVSDISPAQWVAGVGVVALLFGLAFFFKFAIDQGWISEWMRIILGLLVGALFLILGDLWRAKHAKYAQVLSGGGLALLYFTIFAAFHFYHLVEQPLAFAATIGVTVIGIVLSYRYNAKALGLLAVIGGYLSPILVGSGENKQVGLFVYLTILNIGVLLMLLRAFWAELLFVALLGTGLDFTLWAMAFSSSRNTGTSVAFIVFNYLLVGILTAIVFRKLHETKQLSERTDVHLGIFYTVFGIAVFGTVTGLLYDRFESYIAPVMLLLGVITFMSYAVLDRLNYVKVNYPMSLVGTKFLVAAILWQFAGATQNIYLLIAAGLGLGVGFLVNRKDLRVWGLVLLLVTTAKIVVSGSAGALIFLFNSRFGLEMLATVALFTVAAMYEKMKVEQDEAAVPALLRSVAAAVIWIAGSQEILAQYAGFENQNTRNLLLSVWWMAYAVVLAVAGGIRGMRVFRKVAVALFAITVLKVFLYDVQALELGYRVVSFILLGIILLSVAFAYQRNKDQIQKFWEGEAHLPTER